MIEDRLGNVETQIFNEARIRNELHTAIIESLPDALVVVSQDGTICLVNSQAELLFGYHRTLMLGNYIGMLVPESLREIHKEHHQGRIRQMGSRQMGADLDIKGRRFDGTEFPCDIMLAPTVTPSGVYIIAVIRAK